MEHSKLKNHFNPPPPQSCDWGPKKHDLHPKSLQKLTWIIFGTFCVHFSMPPIKLKGYVWPPKNFLNTVFRPLKILILFTHHIQIVIMTCTAPPLILVQHFNQKGQIHWFLCTAICTNMELCSLYMFQYVLCTINIVCSYFMNVF